MYPSSLQTLKCLNHFKICSSNGTSLPISLQFDFFNKGHVRVNLNCQTGKGMAQQDLIHPAMSHSINISMSNELYCLRYLSRAAWTPSTRPSKN